MSNVENKIKGSKKKKNESVANDLHKDVPKKQNYVSTDIKGYIAKIDDNGNIIGYEKILGENEVSFNKNSLKAKKEKDEREKELEELYESLDTSGFVQIKRIVNEILIKLNQSQSHCLAKLLTIIPYGEGFFEIEGKDANTSDLIDYIGLSKPTVTSFLKLMCSEDVKLLKPEKKGKSVYYKMTNKYIFKGAFKEEEKYSVKVFQEDLAKRIAIVEEFMKEEKKKLKKSKKNETDNTVFFPLAMFMAMIPHVHPQVYLICKNIEDTLENHFGAKDPKEVEKSIKRQMSKIKPLNKTQLWRVVSGNKELKKMSGFDLKRMKKYIEVLEEAGIIAGFGPPSKRIYFFNPRLLFVSKVVKNPIIMSFVEGLFDLVDGIEPEEIEEND